MWVPGIELKSSGLLASAFTCWIISSEPRIEFRDFFQCSSLWDLLCFLPGFTDSDLHCRLSWQLCLGESQVSIFELCRTTRFPRLFLTAAQRSTPCCQPSSSSALWLLPLLTEFPVSQLLWCSSLLLDCYTFMHMLIILLVKIESE